MLKRRGAGEACLAFHGRQSSAQMSPCSKNSASHRVDQLPRNCDSKECQVVQGTVEATQDHR